MKMAILDAAERRIRAGGYGGFSFREIAADVGIKSSSVHYHFPTKEDLAVATVRRYGEVVSLHLDEALEKYRDPIEAWTRTIRNPVFTNDHICPCTVLGAASRDLPDQVAAEVKRVFKMLKERLVAEGVVPDKAAEILATLVGATVISNALRDSAEYDRATKGLLRKQSTVAA